MVVSMKSARGASRVGYTRVLDSNRLVNRLDRILSSDRASISTEGRRRWDQDRRQLLRGRKKGAQGAAKYGRYQALGRAYKPLAASRRARNTMVAEASVRQHIADGGPIRGKVSFEYPINVGGQPRLVAGELEFEAAVEDGQPVVTIPLADNINLDENPSETYRATDKAELRLVSQEAGNRSKVENPAPPRSIREPQIQAGQGRAANQPNSAIDPKGNQSARNRFRTTDFYRLNAIKAYTATAANDDHRRFAGRALATA